MLEEWSDQYLLGIDMIDGQHRRFFDATHRLYERVLDCAGEHAVDEALSFLKRYSAEHFAAEEAFMNRHGYPRLAEHKELHAQYLERLEGLADEYDIYRAPTKDMAERILELTQDWLLSHIVDEDTQYARYIDAR
jgi:hemerythrin